MEKQAANGRAAEHVLSIALGIWRTALLRTQVITGLSTAALLGSPGRPSRRLLLARRLLLRVLRDSTADDGQTLTAWVKMATNWSERTVQRVLATVDNPAVGELNKEA